MTTGRKWGLLLRAALLEGEPAIEAWRAWRATVELDDIDWPSMRLVPLLWHNLLAQGVDDPLLARYRTVYRHVWLSTQARVTRMRRIGAALSASGVESIALKGIALGHGYYASPGLRPMDDLDLLIRPADVHAATAALRDDGWTSAHRQPERVLRVVHAEEFRHPATEILDLHAHLFQGSLNGDLDERRWDRAEQLALPDGPLRVLEPTDQLLHVLVHGAESDPPAPRWVADATMILRRRGDAIDWARLARDADAESRGPALAGALAELDSLLPSLLDVAATELLLRQNRRRWTRGLRFEARVAGGWRVFAVRHLVERLVDYRRWRRDGGADRRRVGFVAYLRLNWDLDGLHQLPGQVVRRGGRALAHDLRGLAERMRPRRPGPAATTRR